jgi:DNA-binding NtrC family response regulator
MHKLAVLIVEDDEAVGLNLAAAAEDAGASVIGPVSSVSEALGHLEAGGIDGAVIDIRLDRDVTPVCLKLVEKAVPFVYHSGYTIPDTLAAIQAKPQIVMKPADPETVVNQVLDLVDAAQARTRSSDPAFVMMVSALELLDARGDSVAAIHLQHAIDILAEGRRVDD